MKRSFIIISSITILATASLAKDFNPDMQNYIQQLKGQAKKQNSSFSDFDIKRGEEIFTSAHLGKRGENISCTSCHNINLSQNGKNHFTNKTIKPLSPSANPDRLVDVKEVKKWLKRNFKDVYNRVGTAQEKGDVLYYINSK